MRRNANYLDNFFKEMDNSNYQLGRGIDIYKEEDKYVVEIDMPGFNKEDIKVDYTEDVLFVSAEKETETVENREYYFKNRETKSVSRKIRFNDIKQDAIHGTYEDGVLKLVLPIEIPVEAQPRQIEIK